LIFGDPSRPSRPRFDDHDGTAGVLLIHPFPLPDGSHQAHWPSFRLAPAMVGGINPKRRRKLPGCVVRKARSFTRLPFPSRRVAKILGGFFSCGRSNAKMKGSADFLLSFR
jgi:hypothetical protein